MGQTGTSARTGATRKSAAGRTRALLAALLLTGASTGAQEQVLRQRPQPARDGPPLARLLSKDFSEERWIEMLTSPDLEQREQGYWLLLQRAHLDPAGRAFIERLALDTERLELAWTARLALREMNLHSAYRQRAANPLFGMQDQLFGMQNQMERMLGELMREYPGLQMGMPSLQAPAEPPGEGRVTVRTDVLGVYVERVDPGGAPAVPRGRGLRVGRVEPGTIAHGMGVGPGDVLLRLNGEELRLPQDITDVLRRRGRRAAIVVEWVDDLGTVQESTWTPDVDPQAD